MLDWSSTRIIKIIKLNLGKVGMYGNSGIFTDIGTAMDQILQLNLKTQKLVEDHLGQVTAKGSQCLRG